MASQTEPKRKLLNGKRKKDEKEKTVLKVVLIFTNQYRNTNFTDFHQLILSIETCC
jgi:hypothetical protein